MRPEINAFSVAVGVVESHALHIGCGMMCANILLTQTSAYIDLSDKSSLSNFEQAGKLWCNAGGCSYTNHRI